MNFLVRLADVFPRFIERHIHDALADTRVVLVIGPRQSGKTTLAQHLARNQIEFLTLDDTTVLAAAKQDPVGFVRRLDRAVIDEIQRAPELILALKSSVDNDQRPGRFLLTGSANLMTLPQVADSLAGRMEVVRLLPLAQCEIRDRPSDFLTSVFEGRMPDQGPGVVGDELIATVLAGGYPEALARTSWKRRQTWYLDYLDAIIQRDIRDIADIEQAYQMPKLLRVLGQHAGQLVNYSALGSGLRMNHVTTQRYVTILEQLFLIRTLPPWFTNRLKRLIKTPKIHFIDPGLLAALRDLSPERLRADRNPLGALFETFVLTELLKLATWYSGRLEFSHFRDKDQSEVDIVIEDQGGRVIGIEVKASATVRSSDFAGLRKLEHACGDNFAQGLVLYDHESVVPFGDRLAAVPMSALWA